MFCHLVSASLSIEVILHSVPKHFHDLVEADLNPTKTKQQKTTKMKQTKMSIHSVLLHYFVCFKGKTAIFH